MFINIMVATVAANPALSEEINKGANVASIIPNDPMILLYDATLSRIEFRKGQAG